MEREREVGSGASAGGSEPRGEKPGLYELHGAPSTQKFHLAPSLPCPWAGRAQAPGWVIRQSLQVGLSLAMPSGLTVQPGAEDEPRSSSPPSKPGSLPASKLCRH